jgi:hypothetical protein
MISAFSAPSAFDSVQPVTLVRFAPDNDLGGLYLGVSCTHFAHTFFASIRRLRKRPGTLPISFDSQNCKSAVLRLRWFESSPAHHLFPGEVRRRKSVPAKGRFFRGRCFAPAGIPQCCRGWSEPGDRTKSDPVATSPEKPRPDLLSPKFNDRFDVRAITLRWLYRRHSAVVTDAFTWIVRSRTKET